MTFQILESSNKQEWLEQRQGYLTATDIATLYTGGPKAWQRVAESKKEHPEDFDNQYMAWGREREPVIADYLTTFVDSSLVPNSQLYVSTVHPRIAATPDMVSRDAVGDMMSAEIKTSKTDLSNIPLKYLIQMEVQMLVLGSDYCVFAWEQHDDFVPRQPQHVIVKSDPAKRERILEIADRFYGGEVADGRAQALEELLEVQRHVTAQLAKWKQREDQVKADIIEILGDEDAAISTPLGKISWVLPKPRESFDAKAFAEAHPDLHKQFVKHSAPKSRTLRITLPKEEP